MASLGEQALPDGAVMMDSLPVPVVMLDAEHRIRFVNAAAEPFFGMSKPQLGHLTLQDLVPSDHPLFLLLDQVRSNGITIVEHDLILDGPRLHRAAITVQGTPVLDDERFVLLTFHDASAARALDRQLTFRNAARSVSGMAAILAHEVKNPLSGIRGAAQLLESTVGETDRELAVLIRDEADRIKALVERMEVFGEKPIERRPVNIHRVLEHVRLLAQQGFAAHIRFVEQYDPSLPPVWGDRDQLVQVLLNLVKNAAEAISGDRSESDRPGEITLCTAYQSSVRLAVPGSDQRVHLPLMVRVRDTGPGIPDQIRPHLFEPFLTTKVSGSGLGLALAAKIVGDHGGLIEIDSKPGRTDVVLHLPVLVDDPNDP
ncbi:ATP-binding protein [Acetobacteraceae bacterium KSS8]|uniref:histidine kinase n=1 Tax=Endosaccharibacter trunci TaxID=2812733 RepID=A0ABT1W705_9PROT|nr:ATP-binding protein [Acetobacteraceae bacterium KSS8]